MVDSDTHESRVSPYLVTRDPSLKPTGAVTNTMDKDELWCDGLWSSGKRCTICNYDDNCGGLFGFPVPYEVSLGLFLLILFHIASKRTLTLSSYQIPDN